MTFIGHQDKMIAALSRALACFAVGAGSSDGRDLPRTSFLYAEPSERIAPAKNGLRLSRLGHPVLHWKRGRICPWPDSGWHIFQSRIHGVSVKEGLGWGAWFGCLHRLQSRGRPDQHSATETPWGKFAPPRRRAIRGHAVAAEHGLRMVTAHYVANPDLDDAIPKGLASAVDLAGVEGGDGVIEASAATNEKPTRA
jgi:hypothetical protein